MMMMTYEHYMSISHICIWVWYCCNLSLLDLFDVIFELTYPYNLPCWWVIFLLLLTYLTCLCHPFHVRPCASSSTFLLFSWGPTWPIFWGPTWPIFWGPTWPILRIVSGILQAGLSLCKSLQWDCYCRYLFREALSLVWWCPLPILSSSWDFSFLQAFRICKSIESKRNFINQRKMRLIWILEEYRNA